MWKSFGWFALGYLTARYLILKNGSEAYKAKESQIINKGSEIKTDLQDQFAHN